MPEKDKQHLTPPEITQGYLPEIGIRQSEVGCWLSQERTRVLEFLGHDICSYEYRPEIGLRRGGVLDSRAATPIILSAPPW